MFFKHFASKNQLRGFYISGTFVENGLRTFIAFISFIKAKNFVKSKAARARDYSKEKRSMN